MSYGPALTGFLDLPFPDLKLDNSVEDLFGASLLADEPADAALQLNSLEDLLGVPDIFVDDVPSSQPIRPGEAEEAYQFAVKLPTLQDRKAYLGILSTELRKAVLQLIKDKQARNQQKQAQLAQLQANAAAIQSRRRNDLGAISSSALRAPRSAAPPAPAPNTVTLTEIKQIVAEIDDLKKNKSPVSSVPEDPGLLQAYRQAAVPVSESKAVLTMADLVTGPPPPVPPPLPVLSMPLSLPQTNFLQQLVPAQRPSGKDLSPVWRKKFFQELPLENFDAWKEDAQNRLARRNHANFQWVEFLRMTPEEFLAWKEAQSEEPRLTKLTGQFKNFTLEDFQKWKEDMRAELRRIGYRQPRRAEDRKYFSLSDEDFQRLYEATHNKSSSKKRKAPAAFPSSSSSSRPRIN